MHQPPQPYQTDSWFSPQSKSLRCVLRSARALKSHAFHGKLTPIPALLFDHTVPWVFLAWLLGSFSKALQDTYGHILRITLYKTRETCPLHFYSTAPTYEGPYLALCPRFPF